MSKIPFLFLTTLACNNGKITAGDTKTDVPPTDNGLPNDEGPSNEEGQDPQAETSEDTGLSEDDATVDSESDTGTTPATPEETEDDGEVTLEDYLTTYCETFAVPCMGYTSIDGCVDAMMVAHFTDCTVTDKDALAECDAWVATIDCAETTWNPACDEFITCD